MALSDSASFEAWFKATAEDMHERERLAGFDDGTRGSIVLSRASVPTTTYSPWAEWWATLCRADEDTLARLVDCPSFCGATRQFATAVFSPACDPAAFASRYRCRPFVASAICNALEALPTFLAKHRAHPENDAQPLSPLYFNIFASLSAATQHNGRCVDATGLFYTAIAERLQSAARVSALYTTSKRGFHRVAVFGSSLVGDGGALEYLWHDAWHVFFVRSAGGATTKVDRPLPDHLALNVGLAGCLTDDDAADLLIPILTRPRQLATHQLLVAEFAEHLYQVLDFADPFALVARIHRVMSAALLARADGDQWREYLSHARSLIALANEKK